MKSIVYFLLIILTLLVHVSQSVCPNNCNGHGTCSGTTCSCSPRWFDPPGDTVADCSELFIDYHRTEWDALRAVAAALFGIVGMIAILGGVYSFSNHTDQTIAPLVNIRRIVFGLIASMCFVRVLYLSIDPKGVDGVISEIADRLLASITNLLSFAIFISILFHWVDLYNTAAKAIKTENMLQSINANYQGKLITVEEILSRVQGLQKIKIPVILSLVILTIFSIVSSCLPSVRGVNIGYSVYYGVNWMVLVWGYIIYGRRLVSLMPLHIAKKVRTLTWKITVLCILLISIYAVALIIIYTSKKQLLLQFFIVEFVSVCWVIGTSSIFMRPNRNFPYFFLNTRSGDASSKSNNTLSNRTIEGQSTSTGSMEKVTESTLQLTTNV